MAARAQQVMVEHQASVMISDRVPSVKGGMAALEAIDPSDGSSRPLRASAGRETLTTVESRLELELVWCDVSQASLADPAPDVPGGGPMRTYVEGGQLLRQMPAFLRSQRGKARAVVDGYRTGPTTKPLSRLDMVSPETLVALYRTGTTWAGIASAFGCTEDEARQKARLAVTDAEAAAWADLDEPAAKVEDNTKARKGKNWGT